MVIVNGFRATARKGGWNLRRFRRRLALAVTSALIGAALLPGPAAAATPITFYITVDGTCQAGMGEPEASFNVRLFAPNGDLVEKLTVTSAVSGYWFACFDHPAGPGDKVRATGGGSDRTVTIPNLTAKGNRVTDKVTGHWIPNTALNVCIVHMTTFSLGMFDCVAGASDANGAYSVDFTSTFDVDGGDQAAATYTSGSDEFHVGFTFPYMVATRNDAYVQGTLNPGQEATITLRSGSGNFRGSMTVENGLYLTFEGFFRNSAGSIVRARAGDRVVGTFAGDATLTIPDITASGVPSTDAVTGHCLPNKPFKLFATHANYSDSAYREGTTDASGNFTRDLTADMNLVAGDILELTCRYATGDQVHRVTYVTS